MADYTEIPVSGNLMNPGAAMANTLQQILAQKRMDKRQGMLDQLNSENVRSQMAERASNAAANEEYRKEAAERAREAAANYEEEAYNRRIGGLEPGTLPDGTDPDLINKMKAHGDFGPLGKVEGLQLAPEQTGAEGFLGSADQRSGLRNQKHLHDLLSNPQFNSLPPISKYLQIAPFLPKGAPLPADLFATPKVAGRHVTFDESNGKYFDAAGKPVTDVNANDEITIRSRPPVGNSAASTPKLFQIYKDGKFMGSDVMNPQEADMKAAAGFELRQGNTPITNTHMPGATAPTVKAYREAKAKLDSMTPGWFGSPMGGYSSSQITAQKAVVDDARNALYAEASNGDSAVLGAAEAIKKNPKAANAPIADIVTKVAQANPTWTKDQLAALTKILEYSRNDSTIVATDEGQ